mmetsp:Transcript_17882/g.50854  ORF Transcript_17882/g.50854 Transcript_17882/m.50854 type:complete len:133 (+) Transcript_17882:82-480(+)
MDGRKAKRARPAAPAAAAAAAASSDEERQRRAERERNLIHQITDEPGLLVSIVAFLPLYLLVQLSKDIFQHAAPEHTHLTISCGTQEERSVWQRVPVTLVSQLGALLTRLSRPSPFATPAACRGVHGVWTSS